MKTNRIAVIAVFAVLMVAFIPAIAENSDADILIKSHTSEFDSMKGGKITFVAENNDNSAITVNIVVTKDKKEVATKDNVRLAGMNSTTVEISLPEYKEVGNPTFLVTLYTTSGVELVSFNENANVNKNVLSNPATYILIIILVIVIVALIYMKVRDSPKKEQNMTFEELEEQRKADMAAKNEKKKKDTAPKTERQRYLESKKKE